MVLTYSEMLPLGSPAPDFDLPGVDGRHWRLADFAASPALLLVFTCNHCPYAQAVEDRLITLGRELGLQGLAMALICSNDAAEYPDDSFENMAARSQRKGYPFPYLHDETQQVARAYRAACTPDPFLFDAQRRLVYRGRIDDNWKEPHKVASQELRQAALDVLAGRTPSIDQHPSLGCNIKWKA